MSYSFFPNDFTSLPNIQDQAFLMKQKQVNEGSRPTFTPLTTAYDDSNDPAPNVAALTDEEEEDLRVDRVDNFGGDYPSYGYAQLARSLAMNNDSIQDLSGKMFGDRMNARRDAMSKFHRGRQLSDYGRHTKTRQDAEKKFNQYYTSAPELLAQANGLRVMADISRKIIKAHPEHAAFINAANERAKVD